MKMTDEEFLKILEEIRSLLKNISDATNSMVEELKKK